jgi:hypothetical protein
MIRSLKGTSWYIWAYRRKERLKRFFRYDIPLELHTWRMALKERPLLLEARKKYEHLYRTMDNPLVSVTIPTYNRGKLLTERTLPSVLNQTYQNFEIVIVGDCCTDDTEERIARLNDPRIRFYNLPQRGPYPSDPILLWYVAGVPPMNRALDEARGLWIAHLDDDDVWKPQHLECALAEAYQKNVELVGAPILVEYPPNVWGIYEPKRKQFPFWGEFTKGGLPHSSLVMRSYLRLFRYDMQCWKFAAGGDRHMLTRMAHSGVRYDLLQTPTVLQPLRPGTTHQQYRAEDRVNL